MGIAKIERNSPEVTPCVVDCLSLSFDLMCLAVCCLIVYHSCTSGSCGIYFSVSILEGRAASNSMTLPYRLMSYPRNAKTSFDSNIPDPGIVASVQS